jgi:hypothetical protein
MTIRAVSVDPGGTTGLICLDVPDDFAIERARLVGWATCTPTKSQDLTPPIQQASLFHRVRTNMLKWHPRLITLEKPEDALPQGWAGKGQKRGGPRASRETTFGLGTHYGLALAACSDLPYDVRVCSYPVTTRQPKPITRKGKVVGQRTFQLGWFQRREARPPKREHVLAQLAERFDEIANRPADGVLRSGKILAPPAHVLMALGVLWFHCDRERGKV